MHIPDGIMDPVILAIGFGLAVPLLALVFRRLGREGKDDQLPFMAVLAAGIFAAQMLNFPVIFGTTGHLVGAALAVMLVGLPASVAILAVVIMIQGFFFGDGGITALGLNLLNLAVVAPVVAWGTLKVFRGKANVGALFAASWLSVFLSAGAAAAELSASHVISSGTFGISPWFAIPAMLGYHAIIGVGEGIITVGVWSFITQVAPEVVKAGGDAAEEAAR